MEMVMAKIRLEGTGPNYGRFVMEPLERGFGITMGNALRRVLLSSLPGAAVTAIRIEEAPHEFSTIPHMKEDTMDFLLNVKGLRLRPLSGSPGKLYLEVRGPGTVCAGDIRASADFEVANPELHLATLDSPEGKLTVEFQVELGKGYVPALHGDGQVIGLIPVDAIFTPMRRVNYTVEPTRVGQSSNYDRLILEVWTDGTVTPTAAVGRSAQILVRQLSLFTDLESTLGQEIKEAARHSALPPELYNTPLEQLGLTARTLNCLRRAGITKVGELTEKSEEELLSLRNFGDKSYREVQEKLLEVGALPRPQETLAPAVISTAEELSPGELVAEVEAEEEEEVPEE